MNLIILNKRVISVQDIEKVKEFFKQQNIDLEIIEFSKGETKTCELAAASLGVEPAQIAKSLLFVGKTRNVMVVTCGDRRVNVKKLKEHFGEKFRFARLEEVEQLTGFSPGGVCPFALPSDISIIIDKSLEKFPVVYAAAGNDASAVPVTARQLLEITKGDFLDVC